MLTVIPATASAQQDVPADGCSSTPAQIAENKRVASEFFRPGISGSERLALLDATYVQHSPVFKQYAADNGLSDYEAFRALVVDRAGRGDGSGAGGTAAQPQTPVGNPLEVVIARCDVVTIIHKIYRQDPTAAPGTFYETFTWDAFRMRDGKLVEHWDGATLQAN